MAGAVARLREYQVTTCRLVAFWIIARLDRRMSEEAGLGPLVVWRVERSRYRDLGGCRRLATASW